MIGCGFGEDLVGGLAPGKRFAAIEVFIDGWNELCGRFALTMANVVAAVAIAVIFVTGVLAVSYFIGMFGGVVGTPQLVLIAAFVGVVEAIYVRRWRRKRTLG